MNQRDQPPIRRKSNITPDRGSAPAGARYIGAEKKKRKLPNDYANEFSPFNQTVRTRRRLLFPVLQMARSTRRKTYTAYLFIRLRVPAKHFQ